MPFDRFEISQDDKIVLSNATEDELKNMPEYEEAQYEGSQAEQAQQMQQTQQPAAPAQ